MTSQPQLGLPVLTELCDRHILAHMFRMTPKCHQLALGLGGVERHTSVCEGLTPLNDLADADQLGGLGPARPDELARDVDGDAGWGGDALGGESEGGDGVRELLQGLGTD